MQIKVDKWMTRRQLALKSRAYAFRDSVVNVEVHFTSTRQTLRSMYKMNYSLSNLRREKPKLRTTRTRTRTKTESQLLN